MSNANNDYAKLIGMQMTPVQMVDTIAALRAALDQERADNEKLRAFAQDCEDILGSDDEIQMLLNEHGLTDMDGVPTALLSGRGEVSSDA